MVSSLDIQDPWIYRDYPEGRWKYGPKIQRDERAGNGDADLRFIDI